MSLPLISIIMPAYNCQKYVGIAIDSVLNQTYRNVELLIADDCSTDQTKKVIDNYTDQRIKRFHNNQNLGYLKTCNLLVKQAQGDYITFLDADDINDVTRFEKQISKLNSEPDLDMVGTNIIRIDSQGNETDKTFFFTNHNEIKNAFENYKNPCHYSSLLIKKKVIDSIGLYNEWFNRIGSEDVYWFSFAIEKFKVANLSEHLYYYRKHSASVTATHKNPKAFVGHDLIMKMYQRRKVDKEDFIKSGNWKMADIYADFLIELKQLKEKSKRMSKKLFQLMIIHPFITIEFLSEIKNTK